MITFQELVKRLNHFWEKQGCLLHFGHDLETGAGTFNPATFLRCLGPEPYYAAYVEPSRRPSDGRYGENPNRIQLFHQYQVILKPSPPNIQKLYLDSLKAIGLNLAEHDIRFVHDDWESPTLGAWGLGWEVWIDGMEISQFTYFQAFASLPMKAIPGEITYGLERLAMYLQKVDTIFDLHWNKELTFGDIIHRNEVEWSAYNFQEALPEMWFRHFDDFEKEAKRLIALSLPIPAYDFVVKASHAFNLLDARGVISVTERTGYIGRIRDLSRLIAVAYLSSREKMGFPLLKESPELKVSPQKKSAKKFNPQKNSDFLLEIGSEQLPATFVPLGCENLARLIRKFLQEHDLSFENIHTYGTPQRLAIYVTSLIEGTQPQAIDRKGPSIAVAFDKEGNPTNQGHGFLKSLRYPAVTLDQIKCGEVKGLEIHSLNGAEYLLAHIKQMGKSTAALLTEHLPRLIAEIEFPKKMRWGTGDVSYARPIHWIVALFGNKIIPFEYGEILSGRTSFGHAQMSPKKIGLKDCQSYLSSLREHFVLADITERKKVILDQLQDLEAKYQGTALSREKVLQQVLYLCEWPQLTVGTFDSSFLRAPKEVLISEMVEHQKYFPLGEKEGKLRNSFIITADNTPTIAIVKGNERVLAARLSDGVFLYEQDLKIPLEKGNEKLQRMTFQKDLGSMLEKVQRLVAIAEIINRHLSLAETKKVLRAALLSKADLASELVGEFPELQGIAGKYYALAQKEEEEVAQAIEEQWMPRGENNPLPQTPAGIILSLADKIDNLLSYFSVGLKPTSSSDPYALRRQTLGLVKILIRLERSCDLATILKECAATFSHPIAAEILEEILQFITARAKSVFEEEQNGKYKKDEVEAILYLSCTDPYDAFRKLEALHEFRKNTTTFSQFCEAHKRIKGILKEGSSISFQPELLQEQAEKELFQAIDTIRKSYHETLKSKEYPALFRLLAHLQAPLEKFFNTVKILIDDPKLRNNRLGLVSHAMSLFNPLLDLGKIQN